MKFIDVIEKLIYLIGLLAVVRFFLIKSAFLKFWILTFVICFAIISLILAQNIGDDDRSKMRTYIPSISPFAVLTYFLLVSLIFSSLFLGLFYKKEYQKTILTNFSTVIEEEKEEAVKTKEEIKKEKKTTELDSIVDGIEEEMKAQIAKANQTENAEEEKNLEEDAKVE